MNKILILSYLLMAISGGGVVLPSIVKINAAQEFSATIGHAGYVFSFFVFGTLITQFLNAYLIKVVKLKTELILSAIIYCISTLIITYIKSIDLLIPVLFLMGMVFGIMVTVPFYLIVSTFHGKSRSAKINLLDFYFALGAFIYPIVAGQILSKNMHWHIVYVALTLMFVFILIFLIFTKIPEIYSSSNNEIMVYSKWDSSTYLVMLAIFLNFISFMGCNYWLVDFFNQKFSLNIDIASYSLTFFWVFYSIGCFVAGLLLRTIRVDLYLILSSIVAIFGYLMILYSSTFVLSFIAVSILGFGCSAIYGSCISYGTLLLKKPSPKLLSMFITVSGIGTLISQQYSSYMVKKYSVTSVINVSLFLMILVFFIVTIVSVHNKKLTVKE
jgi:fucose permease